MKASEVIRGALKSNYINGTGGNPNQSEYMCFAIWGWLVENTNLDRETRLSLRDSVVETFMPDIRKHGTDCLMVALKYSDKRYASLERRSKRGHDTPGCYKIRVQYWNNHIAKLEALGL